MSPGFSISFSFEILSFSYKLGYHWVLLRSLMIVACQGKKELLKNLRSLLFFQAT